MVIDPTPTPTPTPTPASAPAPATSPATPAPPAAKDARRPGLTKHRAFSCPLCGADSNVESTHLTAAGLKRYRLCKRCPHAFSTVTPGTGVNAGKEILS